MLTKIAQAVSLSLTVTIAGPAMAESWTLDGANSQIAFGSIKKDTAGEAHSFERLSGFVSSDGSVEVEIDLTSVQTNIDIRNERMIEHVFGDLTTATLSAKIDMDELQSMATGAMSIIDVEGVLSALGQNIDIETEMFVARLSESSVFVTTNTMLFVATEDLGINAGIDKLMELAELPGITRTAPVTLRLIFNLDDKKADVAPAISLPRS